MLVLYAEDDIEDYDLFVTVVQSIRPDVQFLNATNGAETLRMLEDLDVLPDLLFLDINMPALDGKSCLKAMKMEDRLKGIPVIVYTTSSNPRDAEHCLQLGAKAFVQKPFSVTETRHVLEPFFKTEA